MNIYKIILAIVTTTLISFSTLGQVIKEIGFKERGRAAYYPDNRNNATTRSGEVYDMYELAGAHPTIAFGSIVKVTNLDNGKEVNIRINDRPYTKDRVLDLTYSAAKELGMTGKLYVDVKLEVLALNVARSATNTQEKPTGGQKPVTQKPKEKPVQPIESIEIDIAKASEKELIKVFGEVGTYTSKGASVKLAGYGIQVGVFKDIKGALKMMEQIEVHQFKHVVVQTGWAKSHKEYRVMIGSFPSQKSSESTVKLLKGGGYNGFARLHFK